MPSKLYPWALLAVWTFLVPQASFLGHLAGVAVGQLYCGGLLRWAMLGSARIQQLERTPVCQACYGSGLFIAHTGNDALPVSRPGGYAPLSAPAGGGSGRRVLACVCVRARGTTSRALVLSAPLPSHPCSGWLIGPWMAFPSGASLDPLPSSAPPVASSSGGGGGGSSSRGGAAAPHTLGGQQEAPEDPKAAAAAAAEARVNSRK